MECLHKQLREATFRIQEQNETLEIYKQKYTTAIAKLIQLQRLVTLKDKEVRRLLQKVHYDEFSSTFFTLNCFD